MPNTFARRAAAAALALAPLALAALAGCRSADLTETSPTFLSPNTFYTSDASAVAAVNGAYQPLLDWNLWRQPAWISVVCDDDEMQCQNWMAGGFSGNQAGQWYVSRPWTGDYQIIARANDVIGNVPGAAGISAAARQRALGQAYFIRGYAYFDLVRRFGEVPLRLESYVPSTAAGEMPRAPIPDVYKVITADLRRAADSLPTAAYAEAVGGGRPTAVSAWGLLSKVYLHMAGAEVAGTSLAANKQVYLDSARFFAQKVMGSGQTALEPNYMDLFDIAKQNTSKEILFSVQASAAGVQGSELPGFFAPPDYVLAGGGASGFIGMRRDFYHTFAPNDARVAPNKAVFVHWTYSTSSTDKGIPAIWKDSLAQLSLVKDSVTNYGAWTEQCGAYGQDTHLLLTRAPGATKTDTAKVSVAPTVFINKYVDPNGLSKTGNSNNPIVLRYADVLLAYAEAENALRGPANAYAAINQVRARAGLAPLAGLSQAQFAESVYVERKHELYAEFQSRFDMVRLGRYLTDMNKPPRDGSSAAACRPRQAFQVLFPLPEAELAGNPALHQNPGY